MKRNPIGSVFIVTSLLLFGCEYQSPASAVKDAANNSGAAYVTSPEVLYPHDVRNQARLKCRTSLIYNVKLNEAGNSINQVKLDINRGVCSEADLAKILYDKKYAHFIMTSPSPIILTNLEYAPSPASGWVMLIARQGANTFYISDRRQPYKSDKGAPWVSLGIDPGPGEEYSFSTSGGRYLDGSTNDFLEMLPCAGDEGEVDRSVDPRSIACSTWINGTEYKSSLESGSNGNAQTVLAEVRKQICGAGFEASQYLASCFFR